MSLRDFNLVFLADQEQQLNVVGNFFGIKESTGDVYVSLDDGAFVKRIAGDYQTTNFSTIKVKSSIAQSVLLVAGTGQLTSQNLSVSVAGDVIIAPGNQNTGIEDVTIAPGATGIIAAANAVRKSLIIKALGSNSMGDTGRIAFAPTATKGIEISAGESVVIDSSAAISLYNAGADNFTVSLMEVNSI